MTTISIHSTVSAQPPARQTNRLTDTGITNHSSLNLTYLMQPINQDSQLRDFGIGIDSLPAVYARGRLDVCGYGEL